MFYVYIYFSKIGTFFLLPGHPGQGLTIGNVPAKSGHLAGVTVANVPNALIQDIVKPTCKQSCTCVSLCVKAAGCCRSETGVVGQMGLKPS